MVKGCCGGEMVMWGDLHTTSVDSARGCSCLSCTNRTSGEEASTECTEHTEPSGREEPPTDDTDVHRLGWYGIPAIHTLPTQGV